MSVKPEDLLVFAQGCTDANEAEATLRAAVSRFYYAAFHKVTESFQVPEYAGRGSHEAVNEFLERGADNPDLNKTALKQVSYKLRQLRQYRVIADYRLQEDIKVSVAQTSELQAADIFQDAVDLTGESGA